MKKNSISFLTIFETFVLLLLGGYLVYLYLSNSLVYYIRPDYNLFTILMGITLVSAGILNILLFILKEHIEPTEEKSLITYIRLIFITLIISGGILIPKKGLSSQTAFRRGPNQALMVGSQTILKQKNGAVENSNLFQSPLIDKNSSDKYTIFDWTRLFQVDPEPDNYAGKAVNVVGFVTPSSDGTFSVSRFVVWCCIVDATSISLPVDKKMDSLKADEWIDVKGTFETKTINGNRQAVIKPDSIEKVAQPPDPYFY